MTDNTLLNRAVTTGDTIASDDIDGIKFQRVKLIHGVEGVNDGDVATSNPLPVEINGSPVGQFGELKTVEKTPLVSINSVFPISALRETGTAAGSATLTTTAGERRLQTTASGSDAYTLVTAERGRYQPGYAAEIGVGVRIPVALVGSQSAIWGYSDGINGIYFGVDASGVYVARLSNSVETLVRQANWNADKLDGTGASGLTLDLTRGNIFQIVYTWYGYGAIEFGVVQVGADGQQTVVVAHRTNVSASTSIQDPNLPIIAKVANGGTATAFDMYVGGRQFSVVGKYLPNSRSTSARHFLLAGITTTLTPLVSVRQKSANLNILIRIAGIDCITTGDCQVVAMVNSTIATTPSWTALPDHLSTETALEQDIGSTTMTGGTAVYSILVGTTGAGGNQRGTGQTGGLSIDIPEGQPVTIGVRALTGTVTASVLVRMSEDW